MSGERDTMNDIWEIPKDAIPHIVCAANRFGDLIVPGPRHFDDTMYRLIERLVNIEETKGVAVLSASLGDWEQGFIDQFGRFWSREQAMQIVKDNKQPFDIERNGGSDSLLFSEGLY
jgi:hypothetical protein